MSSDVRSIGSLDAKGVALATLELQDDRPDCLVTSLAVSLVAMSDPALLSQCFAVPWQYFDPAADGIHCPVGRTMYLYLYSESALESTRGKLFEISLKSRNKRVDFSRKYFSSPNFIIYNYHR